MDITEKLAEILFNIHANQLVPFYESDKDDLKWDTLIVKTDNPSHIDKDFFRKIAQDILYECAQDKTNNDKLPKILFEIHAKMLPPYYMTFENYKLYQNDLEDLLSRDNWDTLAENANDEFLVDKDFFYRIAKYIIDSIDLK